MSTSPRRSLLSALLALAMLLVACGGTPGAATSSEEGQAEGGPESTQDPTQGPGTSDETLRIVTSFPIGGMDPLDHGFWFNEFGAAQIPMRVVDDGQEPWLLESLELVDEVTWQLTLRDGITFHNGSELDASALARLLERQLEMHPTASAQLAGATVEISGDLQVDLITAGPATQVPSLLAQEGVFGVYDVLAVEAADGDDTALLEGGIYTGPYVPVELTDDRLVLERNPDYWQGTPAMGGVLVRIVPDDGARMLALQSGEADIALYPPAEAAEVFAEEGAVQLVSGEGDARGGFRLVFNLDAAPTDDVAVRRAVALALDEAGVADTMGAGYSPATGIVPSHLDGALELQRFDLDEATQLLDEAGWELGSDGVRERDGEQLQVTLLTYPQQPDSRTIGITLQAQLADAGIGAELRQVESINDHMADEDDWSLALVSTGMVSLGGSVESPLRINVARDGPRNHTGFASAEVDELITVLETTFDEAERLAALERIQRIIVEDEVVQIYAVFRASRYATSPRLAHLPPDPGMVWVDWQTAPRS